MVAGLDGLEANLLTEMQVGWDATSYAGSRGWLPEAMAAATEPLRARGPIDGTDLSENGRTMRDRIESITDSLMRPVITALGDDLPGLLDTLNGWSQQIIDRGWFPPDPCKRDQPAGPGPRRQPGQGQADRALTEHDDRFAEHDAQPLDGVQAYRERFQQ